MSQLSDAVRVALGQSVMADATADIKRLLCAELASVDPSAIVHPTEYFNHTYVPDVVVVWPDREPRQVFLRFVSSPERLLADSDRLGASGPVIFDLSTAARPDRGGAEVAAVEAAASQAANRSPQLLVTDTEATEHIRPEASQNLVERLVVSNVLRSGRGQLNEGRAQATVQAARASYDAAMEAEPEAVRSAVEATRQILAPEIERRVERSLQLLWWVGGGAPEEFPISVPDDLELNPADTRDFLRLVFTDEQEIDDDSFWSRLAERLTFDMLVDVGHVEQSTNLNRLMRQLSGRLKLSHVILDQRERPFPPDDQLAWGLDDKFLRLRGAEWLCHFTPHGNRFSQRRDEGRPVALASADTRSSDYLVEEAEIDEAARQIVLSRKAVDPSGRRGRSLRELAAGFADDASVRRVTLRSGDSDLDVDFIRMMVGADPDTAVRRMATVAVRLLAAIDEDGRRELAEFLEIRPTGPRSSAE